MCFLYYLKKSIIKKQVSLIKYMGFKLGQKLYVNNIKFKAKKAMIKI